MADLSLELVDPSIAIPPVPSMELDVPSDASAFLSRPKARALSVVTIGLPTSGVSASGTVEYAGTVPNGAELWVAFANPSLGVATVHSPIVNSSATYTVTGLIPGVYRELAFVDLDGSGLISDTEPRVTFNTAPIVLVGTEPLTHETIALRFGRSVPRVTTHNMLTEHALNFKVAPNREMPVRLAICSSLNIDTPHDLGVEAIEERGFNGYVWLPGKRRGNVDISRCRSIFHCGSSWGCSSGT